MKYNLLSAIVLEITREDGGVETPMVGYLLGNTENGESIIYSRKEAFDLVSAHGCVNAEAKVRSRSSERDLVDENGNIYFLKLNENGKKINEMLLPFSKTDNLQKTDSFFEYLKHFYPSQFNK